MQREETDRMGQMERGHTAEVQPDCMTEAYTVGISETHIRNNATVFRVWQMIECGELTKEEGLYLMVNTLADENHRLNQMCNDLIMRMPSRLLVETITGEKIKIGGGLRLIRRKTMKDAEQIASAVAYAMEKCYECPLAEICNENCENMWKRFLTSGRVRGNPFRKKITAKRILKWLKGIVADAWENSVVRRTLILTLIVLAISLIFTGGYNLGKIVGAETQTEEYLDGRLEQ